ncbi:uncharacterized protein LOC130216608 [Danio aesculapii]|uniref:uncharacterized protein LOC130216608 n=1 Tax=Danio aesculapii TaxID=1142201 RepID=UPI0024BFADED|nr:uncharacterized protein LOC130216608 [Danio aesculapii]
MKFLFNALAVMVYFLNNGANGVETVSVSVKEAVSVTLHAAVEMNFNKDIEWYFNGILIAQVHSTASVSFTCTDVQCNKVNERFRDRLKLDHQTGDLTIMTTRRTDSGVYHLKTTNHRGKLYSVSVHDATHTEEKPVIVSVLVVVAAAVVVVVAAGVISFFKNHKSSRQNDSAHTEEKPDVIVFVMMAVAVVSAGVDVILYRWRYESSRQNGK